MAMSRRGYRPIRPNTIQDDTLVASESEQSSLLLFPLHHQLIVTTNRSISSWDGSGVKNLFQSGSGGIVASKRLASCGSMLAVADSHVVVLHDIKKGQQKSYRLKGSEGQVRLLKYAANESQDLYFTTNLLNSVQAFSLKEACLLDTHDTHPSPPAVFALSCDSQLLLSTSINPPLIYLRNIEKKTPPVLIKPECSTSAVVAANFHPEDRAVFLLAFADGCVAVYDAANILKSNGTATRRIASQQVLFNEIAHIKRVHTPTTRGLRNSDIEISGHDPATGSVAVTGHVAGVASAALLPKHRAMAVTVGSDGKCCVIDFSQPSRKTAVLLKTWHLRRPATCMSVVYTPQIPHQVDGPAASGRPSNKDYCIAVGRQDGKVLLFDLEGNQLGERALDPSHSRVIDVEWARKEINSAFKERRKSDVIAAKRRSSIRHDDHHHKKHSSTNYPQSLISRDVQSILPDSTVAQPIEQPGPLTQAQDPKTNRSIFNMELPAFFERGLVRVGARRNHSKRYTVAPVTTSQRHSISKPSDPRRTSGADAKPPPLPTRPIRSPGGQYQARRALTALKAAGHPVSPATARRISRGSSRSAGRVSTVSLPRTKVMMGPRAMPKASRKTLTARSSRSRASRSSAPPRPPKLGYPSMTTQGAYKTAGSHFSTSEESGSEETVIDWTGGPPSPEMPKPLKHSQTKRETTKADSKPAKKGHISLSVSSSSVQSSSKASHIALPESPPKAMKAPQNFSYPSKGHISVPISLEPVSNASSFLPSELNTTSHASSDVVANWGNRRRIPHILRAPTSLTRESTDHQTIRAQQTSDSSGSIRDKSHPMTPGNTQTPMGITLQDNETAQGITKQNRSMDQDRTITTTTERPTSREEPVVSDIKNVPVTENREILFKTKMSSEPPAAYALQDIFPLTNTDHEKGPDVKEPVPEVAPTVPEVEMPMTLRDFQKFLEEEFRALRMEIREGFAAQRRFLGRGHAVPDRQE